MTARIGRRFVVAGMVQGVGYRAFVRRSAWSLGLRGSVRNLPDGTVEVLVAGAATAISALESELRRGPAYSRVVGVSTSEVDLELVANKTFEIR